MHARAWIALPCALSAGLGSVRAQVPLPHPTPFVWQVPPRAPHTASTRTPVDQQVRARGCGEACSLGATIGIITGGIAGFYVGALRESHTGWPILIGAIAGGFTGAMIGSGLDDDTPKVDSTRVAGP